jgi:hypothetical protein
MGTNRPYMICSKFELQYYNYYFSHIPCNRLKYQRAQPSRCVAISCVQLSCNMQALRKREHERRGTKEVPLSGNRQLKKGGSDDVGTWDRSYKAHILRINVLLNGSERAKLCQTGSCNLLCCTNAQPLLGMRLRHVRGKKNWCEIALPAEGLSNSCP